MRTRSPSTWHAVTLAVVAALSGCGLLLGLEDFKDAQPTGAATTGGGGEGGTPVGEGGGGAGGGGPAAGDALWSRIYGDANAQWPNVTTVDSEGNVILAGGFYGTLKFGDTILISSGADDIYVAKLSAGGEPLWAKQFGNSTMQQSAWALATDDVDDIYIAGHFAGAIDFGSTAFQGDNAGDIFVAKFSPSGEHVWSHQFGGQGVQTTTAITIDRSTHDVVMTGTFGTAVDFGDGSLAAAGGTDVFLTRLDAATGNGIWSRRYGDSNAQYGSSIRLDPVGNIVVAGTFDGTIAFGPQTLTNTGELDIFVAKFDAAGNSAWAKQFGGTSIVYVAGMDIDAEGAVVLLAYLKGTVDFGCGSVTSGGKSDLVAAKLDSAGSCQWTERLGGGYIDTVHGLSVDTAGDIVVTGSFADAINCGGEAVAGAGSTDIFVLKLFATGEHLWCKRFGGAEQEEPASVSVDPNSREVVLSAWTRGSVDFGTGLLSSAGQGDILLAKLAP